MYLNSPNLLVKRLKFQTVLKLMLYRNRYGVSNWPVNNAIQFVVWRTLDPGLELSSLSFYIISGVEDLRISGSLELWKYMDVNVWMQENSHVLFFYCVFFVSVFLCVN